MRDSSSSEYIEKVVRINRVAKVVKGGKRMSFSALIVVGDGKGRVGVAIGKANEVADAIAKGLIHAKRNLFRVPLVGTTIPHAAIGKYGAGKVLMKPASQGTGVIAGGSVRAVCEACGIRDILTKSLGSDNPANMIGATMDAFHQMRTMEQVSALRADTAPAETAAP